MKLRSLALVLAALIFPSGGSAQSSLPSLRPITIDDYFQIQAVHDPQLSPDGKWVVYAVDKATLKTDKNETRLWMVPSTGGDALPVTADGASSTHPRWSPDGKFLAFLSARNEGKTQVWLLNRLGGEAQQLTDTVQDVQDFSWSPHGRRLVLVLQDPTPEELDAAKEKSATAHSGTASRFDSEDKKSKSKKPWVIDRLQFKVDELGYLDRRRTHLHILDVTKKSLVQVTSGDFDDSEPSWSPDNKLLAFTSNRSTPDPDLNYNTDIWVVSANNTDKGAHLTQITSNPGLDMSATWSPDGQWITYVSMLDSHLFDYATRHLAVPPAAGGPAKVLTLSLDRMVSSPRFSPDGQSIYFIVDEDGTQNLAQIRFGDGQMGARPISGSVFVASYSLGAGASGNAPSGTIAVQMATIDHPSEIYTLVGGKVTQISHVNDALFAQLKVS